MLREQFNNGRLDAAASKAEILEELCDKLNFDPDAAASLHKQLYRERLTSVVADKKISGDLCLLHESQVFIGPPHTQTAVDCWLVLWLFCRELSVRSRSQDVVQKAEGSFEATSYRELTA